MRKDANYEQISTSGELNGEQAEEGLASDDSMKNQSIQKEVFIPRQDSYKPGSEGDSAFKLHLRRPKFMEETQMTGTERGTVYHTLMQHLPVDVSVVDLQIIEQTIERLLELQICFPIRRRLSNPKSCSDFSIQNQGQSCCEQSG